MAKAIMNWVTICSSVAFPLKHLCLIWVLDVVSHFHWLPSVCLPNQET